MKSLHLTDDRLMFKNEVKNSGIICNLNNENIFSVAEFSIALLLFGLVRRRFLTTVSAVHWSADFLAWYTRSGDTPLVHLLFFLECTTGVGDFSAWSLVKRSTTALVHQVGRYTGNSDNCFQWWELLSFTISLFEDQVLFESKQIL